MLISHVDFLHITSGSATLDSYFETLCSKILPYPIIGGTMATDGNFRFTYTVLSKADVGAALRKIAIFLLAFTFFLLGCESKSSQEAPVTQAPKNPLKIVLTHGPEKEKSITHCPHNS